jgi:adenine-specific DNA-methyltransferase
MGVNISYMGTKRELAPTVVEVIDTAQPGTVLDVFSGMCSVAEALAPKRQVWTNDVQVFAHEVGAALFTSRDDPLGPVAAADIHFDSYIGHVTLVADEFPRSLEAEAKLLAAEDFDSFNASYVTFKTVLAEEQAIFKRRPSTLFTRHYADTFFGIGQAIEIDAIVASVESAIRNRTITPDHRRWLKIGLGRAMLRVSNSTGHFAQFLKPKEQSYRTFIRQRRRQMWSEWLTAADDMAPAGDAEWRKRNRSFNLDSLQLLPTLVEMEDRPSVIYADPPYTDDQYSRFYHVLETLMLYDYPEITGAGRYRTERFRTPFSIKSLAAKALDELIAAVAITGADFVLSYPTNGLVYHSGSDPEEILKRHFKSVERCHALAHIHSTFGASKGAAKSAVTEQIFLGRI